MGLAKTDRLQGEHRQHSQHHANYYWPENAAQEDGGGEKHGMTKHQACSLQLLNRAKPLTTATMWNGTRVVPANSPSTQRPRQIKTPNQRLDEMTSPNMGMLSGGRFAQGEIPVVGFWRASVGAGGLSLA
jgi:hypothetical protein